MGYLIVRGMAWIGMVVLMRLLGGFRVEGRQYVPRKGGVLIAANHISDADPPTVGFAVPRYCWFMAKEELFGIPVIGTLMRWLRAFPVKRYSADRAALRRAQDLLERGEAVVVFPEGKISENGEMQEMYPGVLMLAQHAGVPIVPAIVIGTDRVMPYAQVIPRPAGRTIVVRFGPPLSVSDLTGGVKGGEGYRRGTARLRDVMLALQQGS